MGKPGWVAGDYVFQGIAAVPDRHGSLCHGALLGARADEARSRGAPDAPRRVDCCEERRFFPRRVFEERRDFCCEERFPRRVFFDEERRDFCCEDRRFFPRRVFEERRDFDAAPRPPAGIPGGYYNAGYVQ